MPYFRIIVLLLALFWIMPAASAGAVRRPATLVPGIGLPVERALWILLLGCVAVTSTQASRRNLSRQVLS